MTDSLARHDHPDEDVDENARHAAGDEGDQKREPEPERTDAKEFGQSAAYARDHAVAFGTAQGLFLCGHGTLQGSVFSLSYTQGGRK